MRTLKHLLMAGSAIGLALVMAERASAADMPSLAQPSTEEWMLGGSTEFGGQVFLTKPGAPKVTPTWNNDGTLNIPAYGNSAAGFNQYGNRTDTLFMKSLEFNFAKKDGSLNGELLGANIGENNQKLELEVESPGQWGLELGWDQTDHLRSNTAQTLYTNAGSTNLVMPNSVIQALQTAAFPYGIAVGTGANVYQSGAGVTQGNVNGGPAGTIGANWANVLNGVPNLTATGTLPKLNGVGTVPTYTFNGGATAYLFNGIPYGCLVPPQATATNGGHSICNGATPAATTILNNENVINLGIHRDRKEVAFTWDIGPNFNVKVDYSNEHRTGLQEQGIVFGSSPSAGVMQVPMPIDDTTQDASIAANYFGKTGWGGKWNATLKYDASIYTDSFASFTAENPWGGPNNTAGAGTNCFVSTTTALANCNGYAQFGTAPDNQANTISLQGGVDLPGFKSNRYMGTLQYSRMTQDQGFIAESYNPTNTATAAANSNAANATYSPLSRNSLNGQINTFLSNNVLNTEFSSNLRNKLTFRYYNYQNNTPSFQIGQWILNDSLSSTSYNQHAALFQAYTKQNLSDELIYRFGSTGSVGVFGGWEQYHYSESPANLTNEWTGKVFGQLTPVDSVTIRFDDSFSQRRYSNYNWLQYVGSFSWPLGNLTENPYTANYDLANRDRNKGSLYVDLVTPFGLTLTPTAGYRWDNYPADNNFLINANTVTNAPGNVGQLGLTYDHSYNLGIEADWAINSSVSLSASYTFEHSEQNLLGENSSSADNIAYNSLMTEDVHTLMAGAKFALIPDRLTFKVSGTYAFSTDSWNTTPAGQCLTLTSTAANCGYVSPGNPAYPPAFDRYSHLDASLQYKFDPLLFGNTKMDAVFGIKYIYEQNAVTNWQDNVAPYMFSTLNASTGGSSGFKNLIFMAGDNPNYSAQAIMATLSLKW